MGSLVNSGSELTRMNTTLVTEGKDVDSGAVGETYTKAHLSSGFSAPPRNVNTPAPPAWF